MTGVYLFSLVMGGVLFGHGMTVEDYHLALAGGLIVFFNALPFIPWKDES